MSQLSFELGGDPPPEDKQPEPVAAPEPEPVAAPEPVAIAPVPKPPRPLPDLPELERPRRRKRGELDEALVAGLNPPQRAAVLANEGPVLILAGAGSGKTRALTRKIATLVLHEGLRPWEILAVTFTNKAAGEMRERAGELLGPPADDLWLGTFHSIGVRVLRRHGELLGIARGFTIYDQSDQQSMIGRVMKALNISEKELPAKRFQHYINTQKQECRGPGHPELPIDGFFDKKAAIVFDEYERAMRAAGAVDFGDLIYLPWRLFTEFPIIATEYQSRWRYVLVDEFQDTNRAQYQLLIAALNPERNICVVGDDDQSIYKWRGADVSNILDFDKDFPDARVFRLEQNYRSTGRILAAAGALIARNRTRHEKTLWTERDDGPKVRLFAGQSDVDEARYVLRKIQSLRGSVSLNEMAIFYRTNAQSRSFEDRLRAEGLPYRVVGGLKFYERAEVKDLMAYMKAVANPSDVVSLERIINVPKRGIGRTTVGRIELRAERESCSFWEALCREAMDGTSSMSAKLGPFVELMIDLQRVAETGTASSVLMEIINETRYLALLKEAGTIEADNRAENVQALMDGVDEFCARSQDMSLTAYLEEVTLVTDLDNADLGDEAVVLMTVHTAKGLEFDAVFVTGLEEGLFPHAISSEDADGVEEERRLAYVAMTRAREHLHLTYAHSRRRFGESKPAVVSRFVDEIPAEHLHDDGSYHPPARTSWTGTGGFGAGLSRGGAGHRPKPREAWDDVQATPSYDGFDGAGGEEGDGERYGRGARVFHTMFGEGLVVDDLGGDGDKQKVKARFADGVTRKLVTKVLTRI